VVTLLFAIFLLPLPIAFVGIWFPRMASKMLLGCIAVTTVGALAVIAVGAGAVPTGLAVSSSVNPGLPPGANHFRPFGLLVLGGLCSNWISHTEENVGDTVRGNMCDKRTYL
jgi:hypothetical protein